MKKNPDSVEKLMADMREAARWRWEGYDDCGPLLKTWRPPHEPAPH